MVCVKFMLCVVVLYLITVSDLNGLIITRYHHHYNRHPWISNSIGYKPRIGHISSKPVIHIAATDSPSILSARFENFIYALKIYKDLEGNLNVPRNYVVSESDARWPHYLRGFKLGNCVANVRLGKSFKSPECIQHLNDVGFVWSAHNAAAENLIHALEIYKFIYGNVEVPKQYVVPMEDFRYPTNLRGMKLGLKLVNFRYIILNNVNYPILPSFNSSETPNVFI